METILVTGGAGFIGANFVQLVLSERPGLRVVNLDALTYAGNLENLAGLDPRYAAEGRYAFHHADIADAAATERVFEAERPAVVVNFAAESHVDRSLLEPGVFLRTNVLGTQVLLDAALRHGVRRFHQVSTDEVYGSLGDAGLFTEDTPLDPRSPYAASKASADLLCNAWASTWGLPVTISRCGNNYGPFQFPEKLVPLLIANLLDGQRLPVYGDGLNVRDWIHTGDHCRGILRIVEAGQTGRVYNLGSRNEWTNIDLVRLVIRTVHELLDPADPRRAFVNDDAIEFVADRKGHDRRYAIDPSRAEQELGWAPGVPFAAGLRATVQWYLDNQGWVQRVRSGDYRDWYRRIYGG